MLKCSMFVSPCVCVCVLLAGCCLLLLAVYHFKSLRSPSLHSPCKQRRVHKEKMKSWKQSVFLGGRPSASECHNKSLSSLLPSIRLYCFLCAKDKMLTPQWRDAVRKEEPLGRKTSGRVWRKMRRGGGGKKVSVGVEVTRWSFNDPCGENGPLLQQILRGYFKKKKMKERVSTATEKMKWCSIEMHHRRQKKRGHMAQYVWNGM